MKNQIQIAARRALALGILFAALAVVWIAMVNPAVHEWRDRQDEFERSRKLLVGYQEKALERSQLETLLKTLKQQRKNLPGLVEGVTAPLAAAKLQSDVRQIFAGNAGEVKSTLILSSAAENGFEKVAIRVEGTIPPAALQNVLYQIETHTPYLFTDSIDIHAPELAQTDNANMSQQALSVRWDLHAYRSATQ